MRTTRSVYTTIITALICCTVACTGGGSGGGGGGGNGGDPVDAPMIDSALAVQCGHPGDVGNALGVGHYCDGLADCLGLSAGLCATLGDPNAHFCTKTCTQGSTDQCGTDAMCQCQGTECGCFPNACL